MASPATDEGAAAYGGPDAAAIIFSSSLTHHLSTNEARLPPTHVGVRRVRPSSQAVKEAMKKRGLPALLAAQMSAMQKNNGGGEGKDGNNDNSSRDGGSTTSAGDGPTPPRSTFGSSTFTDEELMNPTKVSYVTTDEDGTERRMTKKEKKKLKSQLMKERLAVMKQLKKQQQNGGEEEDQKTAEVSAVAAIHVPVEDQTKLEDPDDEPSDTMAGDVQSGDDNYYAMKINQTAIEEEVAELLGASNRVPPVVLSAPMVTEAMRRDIICSGPNSPNTGIEIDHRRDITEMDQALSSLWAATLQEAMNVAEDVRSQEAMRPMAYRIVPETWHRLRPESLLGGSQKMSADEQSEEKDKEEDDSKGPTTSTEGSSEIRDEEKRRWAFISTRSALPTFDDDIALVYKLLYRQTNLHIACGSKFGCDLLLYDGSREERHAFAGLRICSCTSADQLALHGITEAMNATDGSVVSLPLPSSYDLAGYVRCLNTAGKLALLATVVRSKGDEKLEPKVAIVDLALEKILSAPTHKKKRRGKKRQQIRKDGSEHLEKKRG